MAPRGLREALGTPESLKIAKRTTFRCHFLACFSAFVSTYVVEHVKMLTHYALWGIILFHFGPITFRFWYRKDRNLQIS